MGNGLRRRDSGYTLVELLVATAMFGLAVAAIYSVFLNFQRTTVNQEEVVDIQQNLRIALDSLNRDITMAGLLIRHGSPAVAEGSDGTTLNLATASPFYAFALVSAGQEVAAGTAAMEEKTFRIAEPEMADQFEAGHKVRIIRPEDGLQPFDPAPGADLIVKRTDRGIPSITVIGFDNAEPVHYKAGDMMVRVGANAPDPSTIRWTLAGTDLKRSVDHAGGGEVLVANIEALQFRYLLGDDRYVDEPTGDQLGSIAGVRVDLTAATRNQLDRVVRGRSLSTVARIRN